MISEVEWQSFFQDGYLRLGQILTVEEVQALKQRADDLALGVIKNPDVQMQLDTGGVYEELPAAVAQFEEGTHFYRKIQGLENDPLFLRLIQTPMFLEVCSRIYGSHAAVSIFRAMIMNKPAGQGTVLPWHQDGGNIWALDRDPLVTIWVALDPATRENGCMDCIPGSHRLGLLSLLGSTVSEENAKIHCPPDRVQPLEVEAGHAILLHNWLIHRSGVNPSPLPRRAFTMCCMDARTRNTLTGNFFPLIAGSQPEADPYVTELFKQRAILEETTKEAVRYAKSLEADNQAGRMMREKAEQELQKLQGSRTRFAKWFS
jgi:ectoine hydroxylase-related dioxygenase (phytanoyl-CoA dioxygenase family)